MKEIQWTDRYSSTDEPDNMGRWARVGYLPHKSKDIFLNIQIAWINKIDDRLIAYVYIGNGRFKNDFSTLDEAKTYCNTQINEFYENYLK